MNVEQPHAKLERIKEGLDWVAKHQLLKNQAYGMLLQEEIERAQKMPDALLLHDYLEIDNFSVSFQDFAQFALEYGFSYLGDASAATMAFETLPREIYDALMEIAPEQVDQEQVVDIITNRAFRCSLLCHDTVNRTVASKVEQLQGLYILSQFIPAESQGKRGYQSRKSKTTIFTEDSVKNQILALVNDCYPRSISFQQLLGNFSSEDKETTAEFLLALYRRGLVAFSDQDSKLSDEINEKPKVFAPARFVAQRALRVPNAHISMVGLSNFATKLAQLCDGSHSTAEIKNVLISQFECGEFALPASVSSLEKVKAIDVLVERTLEEFREHALLENV